MAKQKIDRTTALVVLSRYFSGFDYDAAMETFGDWDAPEMGEFLNNCIKSAETGESYVGSDTAPADRDWWNRVDWSGWEDPSGPEDLPDPKEAAALSELPADKGGVPDPESMYPDDDNVTIYDAVVLGNRDTGYQIAWVTSKPKMAQKAAARAATRWQRTAKVVSVPKSVKDAYDRANEDAEEPVLVPFSM